MSDLPTKDSLVHPEPQSAPIEPAATAPSAASTATATDSAAQPATSVQPLSDSAATSTPAEMTSGADAVTVNLPASNSDDANKAEEVEPQNTLTQRFTEAEWKSLKEFRSSLPEILAEAFPEEESAKVKPFNMWGVQIDPANPKDAKVSVVLMKFLRARNLSVTEAREMLVNTLRWRKSFDIEAALNEKFPEDIFGQLAHVYRHDKEGRPVVYNLYGANKDLKAVFGDVQRFIRWRVAFMERSTQLLDFNEIDQAIQVHDYEGVSLSSRDANSKAAASEATNIFQSHYPELLYKKFFINVPTLLNWIFWLFKPVISANTLAKMSVVGTGKYAISKALLPYIDTKELPERYGGDAKAF